MSEDWFSSTLPKDKIQELWRSSGASRKAFGEKGQGRSLLTVGAKGIGPNTVNSLAELMKQHETVRVKVASDAIDIRALSEQMIDSCGVGRVHRLAALVKQVIIGVTSVLAPLGLTKVGHGSKRKPFRCWLERQRSADLCL